MTFRDHIESVVQAVGIEQAIAKFRITRQTLWNWRTGKITPSLAKLEELGGVVTFHEVEPHKQAKQIAVSVLGVTTASSLECAIPDRVIEYTED